MRVGIDLGGTNIAVGLVNEQYEIIKKGSVPTGRERAFSCIMKDAADLILALLDEAGLTRSDIESIGMGAPGRIDPEKKMIISTSNFPLVQNCNVEEELSKYFPGIPIALENDANAAAYGEVLAGGAKGYSDVVVVTLGTGVGGGIILGGKIHRGENYMAGEVGHMVIVKDGEPCGCGRRGCFEQYASVTALIRDTRAMMEAHPDSLMHEIVKSEGKVSGRTSFLAAKAGDEAGRELVSRYIEYLGCGLMNFIHILQPQAILIGGGISHEGDYLLKPLAEYIDTQGYRGGKNATQLLCAKLGNDAGIIGAAML